MAKKNKNKNSIDVIDLKEKSENSKPISKDNPKEEKLISSSNESFYQKYKIPFLSSIYKVKDKYFDNDKKTFSIFISLILFAFICSLSLIICGILWLSGIFGVLNQTSNDSITAGLLMAIGVCIMVVV